jgi:hypothetical protein
VESADRSAAQAIDASKHAGKDGRKRTLGIARRESAYCSVTFTVNVKVGAFEELLGMVTVSV